MYIGTRAHALYTYYYTRAFASTYTDGARALVLYIMRIGDVCTLYTYRYGRGIANSFTKIINLTMRVRRRRKMREKKDIILCTHDWRWEIRGRRTRESAGSPSNAEILVHIPCVIMTKPVSCGSALTFGRIQYFSKIFRAKSVIYCHIFNSIVCQPSRLCTIW